MAFDPVSGAKSYLIHYADANQSDPKQAIYMGYTESNAWTLFSSNVPATESGDKLFFYVQAYDEVGIGSNDVEKAHYLHDGEFVGSAWSKPAILIKK
ncbi:fibronectin type III domain-containing protein [Enterococcus durans]|nr:fibronectin type III domain-containing protein [Enterococcus durans]